MNDRAPKGAPHKLFYRLGGKAIRRFAIRAALGQLLDYRQGQAGDPELLVVVGCEPISAADIALAIDNGFGVAWPQGDGFAIRWPA